MVDFTNPQSGTLGSGLAQNAGAQLNWRAAYNQYSTDEQTEGRQPIPLQEFIQQMAGEAQRRQQQGQPIMPAQRPIAPGQPAPGAQRGGLMDSIRGLFR